MSRRTRLVVVCVAVFSMAVYIAAYWRISRRAEQQFSGLGLPALFYADPSTPEGFRRHNRVRLLFFPANQVDHLLTGFQAAGRYEPQYALE